jgi:murein DD-endopeptidase MepM/ murein hydrolase activator NlpD
MKSCRWLLPALITLPTLGVVARADYPKISGLEDRQDSEFQAGPSPSVRPLLASLPAIPDRLWVKVRTDVPLPDLAKDLQLTDAGLALLNDVEEAHQFTRGDWLVIPSPSIRKARMLASLDTSEARRSAPLNEPPAPDASAGSGTTNVAESLLRTAQRYGLTIQELLRQNPGQETARLVAGHRQQVAQAGGLRPRVVLGLRPVGSGGLSWPDAPEFGAEGTPPLTNGQSAWIWPTSGQFSSGFGWRWGRMHNGIDIANSVGTTIVAARTGRVIFAGWDDGGYGYKVDLQHADGSVSRYAHNSRLLVRVGEEVAQGTPISLMGNTGRSTGPHLHFEIRMPGRGALNPLQFLPAKA